MKKTNLNIESSAKKNREKAKLGISKKKIEDEIARAIKQLDADVPVGAFLSGGIDSSLVVAIAAKKIGKKIKTFSIGFDEEEYDESKYARAVADELGVDNLIKIITPKDLISEVKNIARIYDEPFADASQIPVSFVRSRESTLKLCLGMVVTSYLLDIRGISFAETNL